MTAYVFLLIPGPNNPPIYTPLDLLKGFELKKTKHPKVVGHKHGNKTPIYVSTNEKIGFIHHA